MRIHEINIKNYRAIEEAQYIFNKNFNVLIGDNAKGKTSILDALAFSLGTFLKGVDGISSIAISQSDKRVSIVKPNSIEPQLPFEIKLKHSYQDKDYSWERTTNKYAGASTTYKSANHLINQVKKDVDAIRKGKDDQKLPLVAYYGVGRLVSELKERKKKKSGSRIEGYRDSLDPRTKQTVALSWMKEMQESIFQEYQSEEKTIDQDLFKAFTHSIESMIPGWSKIQYNLKSDDVLGYFENLGWQQLSLLSSGYKAMTKLAMDIAYRAIVLNPHLGINAVKETEGVVLIDELDMHLHPKWQRQVVSNLKNTFPKIQFVASTHSPFIVQSLTSDEVINLDGEVIDDPINKSIEEIAETEMNIPEVKRSKVFLEYEKIAEEYFELVKDEAQLTTQNSTFRKEELKKKLDELELNFIDDPVYLALMKAERKSGGNDTSNQLITS